MALALAQLGLQAAHQLVALAFHVGQVLVGELGVGVLQLALEQVPVAAQAQPLVNAVVAEVLAARHAFLRVKQDAGEGPDAGTGQGGKQYFTGGVFRSFARHHKRTEKGSNESAGLLRRCSFGF